MIVSMELVYRTQATLFLVLFSRVNIELVPIPLYPLNIPNGIPKEEKEIA